jgi:hypothetical protein
MRLSSAICVAFCCLALAGCAGTSLSVQKPYSSSSSGQKIAYSVNPKVEVSAEALEILDARLKTQLDGGAGADRKVDIVITNYYMRHGATRAMVGIMAGADNILSQVTVRDASGAVLAEFTVESKNPSAWGTSRGMIEEHADKIVSYVKTGKN